jgi:YhcH/YjgK/YiaL family protein
MIVDQISNSKLYESINPRLAKAFKFLITTDLKKFEPGTFEIDGKEIFAMFSAYETHPVDELKWEAHKKYLDIQVLIEGDEKMGFAPLWSVKEVISYNEAKDIAFYTGSGDFVTLGVGQFVIFMPQDAHQPCIQKDRPAPVKKVVIKLQV